MNDDNLKLWHAVEKTDPNATKPFKGRGGFEGTAISPMYLIRQATQMWGPMGGKWGVKIIQDRIEQGAPILNAEGVVIGSESIHIVQVEVYYPGGSVPAFGQTTFCGRNKYGAFTDEEAPKKSLTDALTKGLSWLGFAADVHMGRFDDVKYVNDRKSELAKEAAEAKGQDEKAAAAKLKADALAILNVAAQKGIADLELAWKTITAAMRKACADELAGLKSRAAESEKPEKAVF